MTKIAAELEFSSFAGGRGREPWKCRKETTTKQEPKNRGESFCVCANTRSARTFRIKIDQTGAMQWASAGKEQTAHFITRDFLLFSFSILILCVDGNYGDKSRIESMHARLMSPPSGPEREAQNANSNSAVLTVLIGNDVWIGLVAVWRLLVAD